MRLWNLFKPISISPLPKPAAPRVAPHCSSSPQTRDFFGPPPRFPAHFKVGEHGVTPLSAKAHGQIGPEGGSVKANVKVTGPKGLSVSFGASAAAQRETHVEHKDGYTTYTVDQDVSVTVNGSVDAGEVGFGANRTEGTHARYQVRMKDEDYKKMEAGQIPRPDPFHPETMPEGSTIEMNSSDYEGTGFSASYKSIKAQSKLTEEQGASVVIEKKPGNAVTVTSGPTDAIQSSFSIGVSLGPASAQVGNTHSISTATLNTATYHLDDDHGRAAYDEYLVTGQSPGTYSNGVSDVAQVNTFDDVDSTKLEGSLGPLKASLTTGSEKIHETQVIHPDGTSDVTWTFPVAGGSAELQRHFDAQGKEDLSRQRVTLRLPKNKQSRGIYEALTGTKDNKAADAKLKDGDELVLTFSAEQAKGLAQRAKKYMDKYKQWQSETTVSPAFLDQLSQAKTPADAAQAFLYLDAESSGSELLLFAVGSSASANKHLEPLPGDVTVS